MVVRYIILSIWLILSLIGLSELIHSVKSRLIVGSKRAKTYSVVLLSGIDADRQLLFAAEQQLWLGKVYSDSIIAIDKGVSEQTKEQCLDVAQKYGITYLSDQSKISEYINTEEF